MRHHSEGSFFFIECTIKVQKHLRRNIRLKLEVLGFQNVYVKYKHGFTKTGCCTEKNFNLDQKSKKKQF